MQQRGMLSASIFWAGVIILSILSYIMLKPFLISLISAAMLAYILYPLYKRLIRVLSESSAALLCIILTLVAIILPVGLLIGSLANQAYNIVYEYNINAAVAKVANSTFVEKLHIDFDILKEKVFAFLLGTATDSLQHLPLAIISLLIIILGMYYSLINGPALARHFARYLPFEKKNEVMKDIERATKAMLYGTVFVAIIEFIVAAVGFYILGVKASIILAALIFILAFIPGLGPALVWVPTALIYGLLGYYGIAFGVVILGLIIGLGIELFFRGKILGKTAKIHPFIMILGILGGVPLFGIFGFIIGPLVLVYTIKILENSFYE